MGTLGLSSLLRKSQIVPLILVANLNCSHPDRLQEKNSTGEMEGKIHLSSALKAVWL